MPHNPKIERKLKIAQLLASGLSKQAIAEMEGIARSTIHEWAKDPFVVAEVERLKSELIDSTHQAISLHVQKRTSNLLDEIDEYKSRNRNNAILLQSIAFSLLEKLAARINSLKDEEITTQNLGNLLRTTAVILEKSSTIEGQILGVEKMVNIMAEKGLLFEDIDD